MASDALPSLPLRIGISSCLLGNPVRFDDGHKHSTYITQTLGEYFEFVPLCPEVAIGLGISRPPIRLVSVDGSIRVRGVDNPKQDVTDALIENAEAVARQLHDVSGHLFKKGSPGCGMECVKVYHAQSDMRSGISKPLRRTSVL